MVPYAAMQCARNGHKNTNYPMVITLILSNDKTEIYR